MTQKENKTDLILKLFVFWQGKKKSSKFSCLKDGANTRRRLIIVQQGVITKGFLEQNVQVFRRTVQASAHVGHVHQILIQEEQETIELGVHLILVEGEDLDRVTRMEEIRVRSVVDQHRSWHGATEAREILEKEKKEHETMWRLSQK